MKWLERGDHTLWVVFSVVLTRGLFELLMPLLVPKNGDTYQLVADDKSLVIEESIQPFVQRTRTHLFHNDGAVLLHAIYDGEGSLLSQRTWGFRCYSEGIN